MLAERSSTSPYARLSFHRFNVGVYVKNTIGSHRYEY